MLGFAICYRADRAGGRADAGAALAMVIAQGTLG